MPRIRERTNNLIATQLRLLIDLATEVTDLATEVTDLATEVTDLATEVTDLATDVTDLAKNSPQLLLEMEYFGHVRWDASVFFQKWKENRRIF